MKIDFNIQNLIEERIGKITPAKVFLGLAFFIIAVNVLGLVLNIFNALLPFAVLAVIAYYGYQFLNSSKGQEILQNATNRASDEKSNPVINGQEVRTTPQTADIKAAEKIRTAAATLDIEGETAVEAVAADIASRLSVPAKVNPETGLKEPDMERLLEKEQETKSDVDAVRAQLEERKKRLKGG